MGIALVVAVVGAACGPRIAAAPPPAPAPPTCVGPAGPPDTISSELFTLTNNDRAANGLGPLRWNPQLWCLAHGWSAHIAGMGTLTHRDLNAVIRSPEYRGYYALGENLLRGSRSLTAGAMENAWMNSSGHRANIVGGQFTSFAVAYFITGDGQIFVTANFGG
ncbi:MAG TPA: CAP domain-containing protein [Acidimicrobiia bacterium]|nr:CAP domain-containing protein [Acidimicrobiia bacterium]